MGAEGVPSGTAVFGKVRPSRPVPRDPTPGLLTTKELARAPLERVGDLLLVQRNLTAPLESGDEFLNLRFTELSCEQ